ncbi:GNAT family N-acetyltransferase [Flavobacterium sp. Fl-77]|uniref:GNAT family N-acetyltransferase n=1 Tax=Flavobacterium flavipigmentatum TaxID=2893884 RepID=A0AAJ2VZB9_9FLAO|nr:MULTISPECIES: GNAT family N-acetyltransferase [unclassified Flavobacterium]MDX6183845.1 GNAT family N-acetyltransferase [Flavobacterium sp. Fl-33]MDX6187410.1 GNAT family N-acetyltransferase [Flavobacterium sp. Fl-77]UFH40313.1 GNAT family N-acetyltransferase [Flavobacterium sp. F-70]
MNNIKEITPKETHIVRHSVLRKGKPIESCHFDGDDLNTTHHFGLFSEENLTGIISLFSTSNAIFATQKQAQIRGMAVLETHQKRGIGEALVKHAEKHCIENQVNTIWFNARTAAVKFYEKLGYQVVGKPFDIKEVGEHYLMYKELKYE